MNDRDRPQESTMPDAAAFVILAIAAGMIGASVYFIISGVLHLWD